MKPSVTCPFCHQTSNIYWASHSVWQCNHCSLIFRHSSKSWDKLDSYYQEGWHKDSNNPQIVGGTDSKLAQIYTKLILKQLQRPNLQEQNILDFGAGKGTMIQAMADSGATVFGVDPYSSSFLKSTGIEAFPSLEHLPGDLRFNGIVAIQVIEHLPKPWIILEAFRDKLVDSGWIYLSTINVDSLNARLLGSHWREVNNPGHLYFYNKTSMENILNESGFKKMKQVNDIIQYPMHTHLRQKVSCVFQKLSLGGELTYFARRD